MNGEKLIYRREDISCADYLMSLAEPLRYEFLRFHKDYLVGDFSKRQAGEHPMYLPSKVQNKPDIWGQTVIKYALNGRLELMDFETRYWFPTAIKLTNEFHPDCPMSMYSSIEPGGIVGRHNGETRTGEYVRVHIPLIIPPGDTFFEVGGEVVYWDDIFAFENQTVHSAYNFTDQRRLIFMLDIRRSRLGLPPGRPFDKALDCDAYPPFDPEQHRKHKND